MLLINKSSQSSVWTETDRKDRRNCITFPPAFPVFLLFSVAAKERCYQFDYPHRDNQEKFSLYAANLCQTIAMEADTYRQKHRVQELSQSYRPMPKATCYTLKNGGLKPKFSSLKYYAFHPYTLLPLSQKIDQIKAAAPAARSLPISRLCKGCYRQSSRKFSQENKFISQPTLRNNSTNTRTNT